MQRLRNTKTGLRFFLPTALLVVSLFACGALLAGRPSAVKTAQAATPHLVSNVPNVPTPGGRLQFGAYLIADNTPEKLEQTLGQELNITGWFTHWNKPLANQKLVHACKEGYVPAITWESWQGAAKGVATPYNLADIAAGKFDDKIRHDLRQLAEVCRDQTVIIRFNHEMNLDSGNPAWYPWQGDPDTYIHAWRHVVQIGRKTAPHVAWLWAPNRGSETAAAYYPGDSWVDYVGITLNQPDYEPDQAQSFAKFYEQNRGVLESFNKPIIIAETAAVEGNSVARKADWVAGMFDFANKHRRITALIWFNESRKKPGVDQNGYLIDSSADTLEAFRSSLRDLRNQETR